MLLCWYEQGISFSGYGIHLLKKQLKAIELAADLPFQVVRQQAAIASTELFQPCASIPAQRRVSGYALRK